MPRPILRSIAVALTLGGCTGGGVIDPQGPIGSGERLILFDSLAIMLVIVVPVIAATLGVAWWFRASNARARRQPDWSYSGQLEFIVWAIPALVVMFLGAVAWVGSHDLDPSRPLGSAPPVEVDVVSLDWKWLFLYPEQHVATVNRLVIPAGRPVRFRLTSATVMNSFFIPQLGSQIYTMAGMATTLHLRADRPGVFHGLSAHFSGDGFSGMHFDVYAVPAAAFATWAAASRRRPPLDLRAYAALARESMDVPPMTFGAVAPGLFGMIVRQTAPPASAPPAKRMMTAITPKAGD